MAGNSSFENFVRAEIANRCENCKTAEVLWARYNQLSAEVKRLKEFQDMLKGQRRLGTVVVGLFMAAIAAGTLWVQWRAQEAQAAQAAAMVEKASQVDAALVEQLRELRTEIHRAAPDRSRPPYRHAAPADPATDP